MSSSGRGRSPGRSSKWPLLMAHLPSRFMASPSASTPKAARSIDSPAMATGRRKTTVRTTPWKPRPAPGPPRTMCGRSNGIVGEPSQRTNRAPFDDAVDIERSGCDWNTERARRTVPCTPAHRSPALAILRDRPGQGLLTPSRLNCPMRTDGGNVSTGEAPSPRLPRSRWPCRQPHEVQDRRPVPPEHPARAHQQRLARGQAHLLVHSRLTPRGPGRRRKMRHFRIGPPQSRRRRHVGIAATSPRPVPQYPALEGWACQLGTGGLTSMPGTTEHGITPKERHLNPGSGRNCL
jgi:hypothetical protein